MVAARLGIPHLSMDATRQRILPNAAHTRADREVAYRAMHFAAELLLQAGAGVVLDAPYGHEEDRADLAGIAGRSEVYLIECRVTPEEVVRRFHARGPDPNRPDLTEGSVRHSAAGYAYQRTGLMLDTVSTPLADCLTRILSFLSRQ